jgi:hypothetical protein
MGKNIYVGNLSYDTTQEQLQTLFEAYGEVSSVNVITDRHTGRPRCIERPGSGWAGADGERGQAPRVTRWWPRSWWQSRWWPRQVVMPPR